MPFAATWIQPEIIMLYELSQKEKDKYHITYTWNLKYDTVELYYETETESQTLKTDGGCQNGGWRRNGGEVGVTICKLFYREWINN